MRKLGLLPDSTQAGRFQRFLAVQSMETRTIATDGGVEIWVVEEDHVSAAREALAEFAAAPASEKYNIAPVATPPQPVRPGPNPRRQSRWIADGSVHLTAALISISVLVTVLTLFGREESSLKADLRFSNLPDSQLAPPEIVHGQVWRLWTPIFLHLSEIHLLFNMLMLWRLGGQIEFMKGWWTLGALVLLIGAVSNFAQYYLVHGFFGGMSGVIYGLFGYQWVRSRWLPDDGYWVSDDTVLWLMAWMFICMTGHVGPVANEAHVAGLLSGLALGALPLLWRDA